MVSRTGARLARRGAVAGGALLVMAALQPPGAVAATCPNATLLPRSADLALARSATVCLLNQERARLGLPALRAEINLIRAAQRHSEDMAARHYFSHTTRGGPSTIPRLLQTGYARPDQHYEFGEALGYNYREAAIPARMIVQILRSSLHRAKLLARRFQHVGVGIAPAPPFPRPGYAGATYTIDVGLRSP